MLNCHFNDSAKKLVVDRLTAIMITHWRNINTAIDHSDKVGKSLDILTNFPHNTTILSLFREAICSLSKF